MIIYNVQDIIRYSNIHDIYENPNIADDQIIYIREDGCFVASTKMYKLIKIALLNTERKNKLNKINLI